MSPPMLVGIAGPTCSGKTTLAERIARGVGRGSPCLISMDSYYRDLGAVEAADRERFNFDHPEALDLDLLEEHLAALAARKEIEAPVYDFASHTRSARGRWMRAGEWVIVEGLFALHRRGVRDLLDLKVYVELDEEGCLERRLLRDTQERGRTPESVRQQFREMVEPMGRRFVRPSAALADVVISGRQPVDEAAGIVLQRMGRLIEDRPGARGVREARGVPVAPGGRVRGR